ncbi:MAG TPA: M23 family metallopeptidase [Gemmatimonadaceae bacterium]|jgi:murein DD-endopeptidase MepM/ murein hydrolase activator NlpD
MATKQRPQRQTGWTILIVPPNPLRKTRAVHIRRRHVRVVLAILGFCTLTIAGLGVVVFGDTLQVTATADELADAHQMILTLTDSLQSVADLDLPDDESAATNAKNASAHGARVTEVGLARPAHGITLPVVGVITSRFSRSRWHPILRIFRPHKGVDVAAPYGSNITAPAAGRVTFVGRKLGDGLMVELDHGNGVTSRYAHCSAVKVRVGDFVSFGDVIAAVGSSGLSTAPHVHFEVRIRGEPVDPLKYLIQARLTPQKTPEPAPVIQAGTPTPHRPAGTGSENP